MNTHTDSIHSFTLKDIDGRERPLAQFKGKVLLLVNVASQCGKTPQYAGLEAMYKKYKGRGFEVLGFPANEFGAQEPGTDAEIKEFCTTHYGVSFPMFSKIKVKGVGLHPLYDYLTTASPFPGEIRWNFAKFLVGRDGQVLARFDPSVAPEAPELVGAIEKAL